MEIPIGQRLCSTFGCLVVALATVSGCASSKEQAEPWTPNPLVSWDHVSPPSAPTPSDKYVLVADEPTVGLFPANLGVTRVAIGECDEGHNHPILVADPRNEFLRWNYAFDDLMALSDVFPIIQRDLGGGEAVPDQILAAFHALHAKLALVYAVNELSETETEMFGTLYDAGSGRPIASLHASAESLPVPEDAEDSEDPFLLWETDSRAIVRDKFAATLHDCVRELILTDQPPALEDKSGWTPAGPVRPVQWPPKRYKRHGR